MNINLNVIFHHIGIAVNNLKRSKQQYSIMGYSAGTEIYVPTQKVKICFLTKPEEPRIELIESTAEDSPINTIIKKNGAGPYHTCYITNDLDLTIKQFKKNKFFILNKPVKSTAFNNNLICFLYNKDIGLIELVELGEKNNE